MVLRAGLRLPIARFGPRSACPVQAALGPFCGLLSLSTDLPPYTEAGHPPAGHPVSARMRSAGRAARGRKVAGSRPTRPGQHLGSLPSAPAFNPRRRLPL